jgi:6,7-dimethyl-8-ribityllumazine synthase
MDQSSQNTPADLQIAIVQARWHADIVDEACKAFIDEIGRKTNAAPRIDVFDVPGAFELPLQARMLAKTGRYAAIVACAFVVDGGIYRHEYVAQTVLDGLMQAQMEADVPVLSVVLTPHHFHDSDRHEEFFLEHFKVKGIEAAEVCMQVLNVREEIRAVA